MNSKKTVRLVFPVDLGRRIKAAAVLRDLSPSTWAARVLREHLSDQGEEDRKTVRAAVAALAAGIARERAIRAFDRMAGPDGGLP